MGATRVLKAAAALLLAVALGACSRPAVPEVDPPDWNFGSIPSSHVAKKQVEIRNPGSRSVTLRFISTCDCLRAVGAPGQLAAGQTAAVELSYDPAGRSGFEEAALIVVAVRGRRESRTALRVHGKVLPAGVGSPAP